MKLDFGLGTLVHVDHQYTDTIQVPKGMHVSKCMQMFHSDSTSDRMSSLITIAIVSSFDKQDSTECIS